MKDKLSASKKNKKIIKLLALYFTVFQNFLEFTTCFEAMRYELPVIVQKSDRPVSKTMVFHWLNDQKHLILHVN